MPRDDGIIGSFLISIPSIRLIQLDAIALPVNDRDAKALRKPHE
jgi:hypothetical protein